MGAGELYPRVIGLPMRAFRSPTSSAASLISIVLVYMVIIAVILLFARQIISDASLESPFSSYIVIPIAIVIPAFLLAAIIWNGIRILRELRRGKAGVRLKIRLMLFFTFVTLLSALPQAILSVSFIEIAMNRWFSSPVKEGVEDGVELVLQYNREKVEELRTFATSPLLTASLNRLSVSPDSVWRDVTGTSSFVDSMQVFSDGGFDRFFGHPAGRVNRNDLTAAEGLLPKQIYGDYSAIRYVIRHRTGGKEYLAVLTSLVPKEIDIKAERLTDSRDTFSQIDLFLPMFRVTIIIFYAFFAFPLILLSILVSVLLAEELVQPIVSLEEATKRVAEGDYSFRVLERTGHELTELVRSFNSMVSELERSRAQLLQTEKVTAWQEIAQRMAHEIKNPLTPIKLSAQRILYRYRKGPEELERILEPAINSIVEEVDNLDDLLREFRDFARLPAPELEPVLLSEIIEEILAIYTRAHPDVMVDSNGLDQEIIVEGDRNQLKRAFTNLIKNAFEAIPGQGKIILRSNLVRKGNAQYSRLQIEDSGSGIDPDFHDKVFNPYYTTKDAGTGLGLPIVERIVFDHNGQIWFETQKGVGTTFFIDLPIGAVGGVDSHHR